MTSLNIKSFLRAQEQTPEQLDLLTRAAAQSNQSDHDYNRRDTQISIRTLQARPAIEWHIDFTSWQCIGGNQTQTPYAFYTV